MTGPTGTDDLTVSNLIERFFKKNGINCINLNKDTQNRKTYSRKKLKAICKKFNIASIEKVWIRELENFNCIKEYLREHS